MPNQLLTIQQVADQLQMSYTKIYKMIATDKIIVASQVGRQWRVKQSDLDNYLNEVK